MESGRVKIFFGTLISFGLGFAGLSEAKQNTPPDIPLTPVGQKFETKYADQLDKLRVELSASIPEESKAKGRALNAFLASEALDAKFAKFVVLHEATPKGLATYAQ